MISGPCQEIFFFVVTLNPESNCTCREKHHSPIEIHRRDQGYKYVLDVVLEKSIDDYWNVDWDRELSDTWTSFSRIIVLDEKTPDGCTWSEKRLTTSIQTSIFEARNLEQASKQRKKQKWTVEKPKLDWNTETCRCFHNCKTKYACIVEADESTRKRMERTLHKIMLQGKELIHWANLLNFVRKFVPCLKYWQYPMRKLQWREKGKLDKMPAWQPTKVRNKREMTAEARNERKTAHVRHWLWHLKNSVGVTVSETVELFPEVTWKKMIQALSQCFWRKVQHHDGSKSDGCRGKATRRHKTSSRRKTQEKWKMLHRNAQIVSTVLLERNPYGHLARLSRESNSRKFYQNTGWEKVPNWE